MVVEPIKPRVLLVAGPNGSGKTTITEPGRVGKRFYRLPTRNWQQ